VRPDLSKPQPPRVPPDLASANDWLLSDDSGVSHSLVSGDFSGQSGRDVEIEKCRILNARFTGGLLPRLRLTDVLVENSDFSGADLDEVSLNRVEFRDCRMSAAILSGSVLRDVVISGCRLGGTNFRMSETKVVVFDGDDLHESDFYAASLDGTCFFDCDLTGAEFSQARTPAVRFHGSDLTDLKGSQYLAGAVIQSNQVLSVALGVLRAFDIVVDDERDPSLGTGTRPRS